MSNNELSVEFALVGINTEQFAIFEKSYKTNKEVELNTNIQFKIDSDNFRIGCFITFEFTQTSKVFIKIETSCHFLVSKESWTLMLDNEKNELVVPKGFLAHMGMLTTGTSRGILFSKTEGSQFSKFIIPTLNVEEMIPEDARFDIES